MELHIASRSDFIKKHKSQLEFCTLQKCNLATHKMRQVYMYCECCASCNLSLKLKYCSTSGYCELYHSIFNNECVTKARPELNEGNANFNLDQFLEAQQLAKKQFRGVPGFVKEEILNMMKIDPDINPKRAHKNLINNGTERIDNNEEVYEEKYIPELKKVSIMYVTYIILTCMYIIQYVVYAYLVISLIENRYRHG